MAQPMTDPQPESLLLRAALTYAGRGWPVFPAHTPGETGCSCRKPECSSVGKHPRTRNGLSDATLDEATILRWWEMWPDANVGIACGPAKMAVLDVDPRHGGDESLRDLVEKHGDEWLSTPSVLTGGGGTHYLYRMPEPPIRNGTNLLPGIDVRGDGGYIIAPPSLHESGRLYAWEHTVNELAALDWPASLIPRSTSRRQPTTILTGDEIPLGKRDETLTRLAGVMRRRGMDESAILAALLDTNRNRCAPPLPEQDVRRIAHSIARYSPSDDIPLKLQRGHTTYSRLRKWLTEPPVYELRVNETDVKVSMAVLINHASLRKAIAEQADIVLDRMKADEWDAQLKGLMEEMQLLEAPEEASESGVLWSAITTYLSRADDDEEALERGLPVKDASAVYFLPADLRRHIRNEGLQFRAGEIWTVVRAHGGSYMDKRMNKRNRHMWAILLAEVER